MEKTYQPIDCDYYDRLEAWATQQTDCQIKYKDGSEEKEVHGRIEDVYTHEHIEYLRMNNGQVIRLDTLVTVNDVPLPGR
jgi:Rho-binding antiterminator